MRNKLVYAQIVQNLLSRLLGWDIRWLRNVQSKLDYPDFFSGPNFVMDIY